MNRWAPWFCAVLTACVFFLSATSASAQRQRSRSAQVCVPGAQSACACVGGASGVQRCNASGTALLPCECPDTPAIAPASSPARWGRADDSPTLTRSAEASTPASTFSAASGERRWYGWQILIPDLAGSLLYTTGALIGGTGGLALQITGAVEWFFAGPIVHWAHGHLGRGFASMFGLRLGLPIGGGLIGGLIGASSGSSVAAFVGLSLGVGIGSLTGIIVDIAALAYDEPAANVRASRRVPFIAPYAMFMPYDSQRATAIVGLQGRF